MTTSQTRVILIRHGEARVQNAGVMSGHDSCTGLTDLGRAQAAALRDRLVKTRELATVDAVYTSVLERAIETAGIIGPALGWPGPRAECDWCEIHAGGADGLSIAELRRLNPWIGDNDDPFRRREPGGETWAECYVRVGARLGRAAREHPGGRVVVVGHGGTIGASFVALGELPMRSVKALTHETINTSITEWRHAGDGWRLVRFNDAAHLNEAAYR